MKEKSLLALTKYMKAKKIFENMDELKNILKEYPSNDEQIWRLGIALNMGYILGVRAERAKRAGKG